MEKRTAIILGALVVVFGALISVGIWQSKSSTIDYSVYNAQAINAPTEDMGNYAENIEGNPDAPVMIYEYGDYQCTACAPMNPYVNEVLEEYGDNLGIVFRTTIMSYHQNGTAAAAAANAAAKQGYWKEFKDIAFANQNDWYYSDSIQRQEQFEEYFMKASGGKGDLKQFQQDMGSQDVQKKINYDQAMAEQVGVDFTPQFYIDGELIDQRNMTTTDFQDKLRAAIDKKLAEKGIKVDKKSETKK